MLQGGDFTDGNGRGGESIYGEKVRQLFMDLQLQTLIGCCYVFQPTHVPFE